MKHRCQLLITVFILLSSQTGQSQNFIFEKIPSWVKEVEIPENYSVTQYDILSGYYLTLADYQINLEENMTFTREVINVLSYGGITKASQISVIFDTSYQQLRIHHLYIWRKGKKIDRTDSLSLEIMNNENNLDQGIYTGKINAYDILKDIRKNDLIDFAYTLVGNNPIFGNEKYLFIPLASMNPIDLYSIRVLYLKDKEYSFHCTGNDSLLSVSEIDGFKQIEIKLENVAGIKYEDFIPTWHIPYDYFTLSSLRSWKDVNDWANSVFALKTLPRFDDVFNEIFTGQETTDEKINKIINYVQDDIRYMGIESGIGSIKPFPPEQVVKHRFGDCKDKSLLMVSLLKSIGIDKAWPALVNTVFRQEINKQYPSNQLFNHCIVVFEFQDSTYWIDPTIAMQGGDYKDLFCPDYGYALIIGVPSDSLQVMTSSEKTSGINLIEELTINSFTEPAKLTITSSRFGFEADSRRAALEYFTLDNISEQLTKELKLLYPEVNQTDEPKITDDIEKNAVAADYHYEVDGFWHDGDQGTDNSTKGLWIFKYEPLSLYEYLNWTACAERKYDLELKFPLNLNCRLIFHFPKDILITDGYKMVENEAYTFEEKIEQMNNNSLQIDYNFKIKSNHVKANDFMKICSQTKELVSGLPLIIYFTK